MKSFVFGLVVFGLLVGTPAVAHEEGFPFVSHKARTSVLEVLHAVEANGNEKRFLEGFNRLQVERPSFQSYQALRFFLKTSVDVEVRSCRDVFDELRFPVETYNADRTRHSIIPRECYSGERIVLYQNQPLFSLECGNMILFLGRIGKPSQPDPQPQSRPDPQVCTTTTRRRVEEVHNLGVGVNGFHVYASSSLSQPVYATDQTVACR